MLDEGNINLVMFPTVGVFLELCVLILACQLSFFQIQFFLAMVLRTSALQQVREGGFYYVVLPLHIDVYFIIQ